MKFPEDITELLKRKFKNKHKEWLKETISKNDNENTWPLEINLGIPTERDALKQPDNVRTWISAWKTCQYSGSLVWSERRWRSLGTQRVPEKLILNNPDDTAAWTGETTRWSRAVTRFKSLVQNWPALLDALPKHFNILADYNDGDFNSLYEILSWICANPNSNLYIRQIPVVGINSKWLELRKGIIAELITAIKGGTSERCTSDSDTFIEQEIPSRNFYKICGLKPLPQLIRIRILDPKLRKMFGGLGDISAPLNEITNLGFTTSLTIFIIENVQTALAFGDLENSIVLFGLGYGVDILGKLQWLKQSRCIYWGDIDTHGFAILNRARSYLPNLETILMDEATLMSHRELWVEEKDQHAAAELPNLSIDELKLYQSLKNNTWGKGVRLEQERVRWDNAWNTTPVFQQLKM